MTHPRTAPPRRWLPFGLATLLLSGCAEASWTRPDTTSAMLHADLDACADEADDQASFDAVHRATEESMRQRREAWTIGAFRGQKQVAYHHAYQTALATCMKDLGYSQTMEPGGEEGPLPSPAPDPTRRRHYPDVPEPWWSLRTVPHTVPRPVPPRPVPARVVVTSWKKMASRPL